MSTLEGFLEDEAAAWRLLRFDDYRQAELRDANEQQGEEHPGSQDLPAGVNLGISAKKATEIPWADLCDSCAAVTPESIGKLLDPTVGSKASLRTARILVVNMSSGVLPVRIHLAPRHLFQSAEISAVATSGSASLGTSVYTPEQPLLHLFPNRLQRFKVKPDTLVTIRDAPPQRLVVTVNILVVVRDEGILDTFEADDERAKSGSVKTS